MSRRIILLPLMVLALFTLPGSLRVIALSTEPHRADFVVSSKGSDVAPGTANAPFATLGRAQKAVRDKLTADGNQDVTVLLGGGTYFITEPLKFGPDDGGNDKHAVVYAAAPGETAIISGGRRITGWQANDDGTWSTMLPEVQAGKWMFRELFIGGKRRQRARAPNAGYFRVAQVGPDKRTSFTAKPGDLPKKGTLAGVELVFLHDWSTSRVPIESVDPKANMVKLAHPLGPAAAHYRMDHFEPNPRYFLENSRSFLDAPGEWFLDQASGVLTYWPLPGETIETLDAIAPVATQLLVVRGTDQAPVRNLRFRGLNFRHCGWQLPKGGYAAGQAGYHERRDGTPGNELREPIPEAILFERAEGCRFEEGRIEHLGGSGIRLGQECKNCTLVGTVISDVAGNGVLIGEDRNRRVNGKPWTDAAPDQAARGNAITDCLIERCGQVFSGSVGIWVGMANHTVIAHNVIHHLPYTGISVGWMWNPTPTPCHDNSIEHNHIHDVMQVLSDGGGIYTLGRQPGTVLRGNRIHSIPLNLGRAESNGMFLDEGTTDLLIEENLIYGIDRSPLRFHRAGKNLVRKNHLVLGSDLPAVRYNNTPEENIHLEDNTVQKEKEFNADQAETLLPKAGPRPPYRERLSQNGEGMMSVE